MLKKLIVHNSHEKHENQVTMTYIYQIFDNTAPKKTILMDVKLYFLLWFVVVCAGGYVLTVNYQMLFGKYVQQTLNP